MKKTATNSRRLGTACLAACLAAGLSLSLVCGAQEGGAQAEPVTAEAVISECMAIIEAEGWTAQDVADAVRSLRGLYLRDNSSTEGRRRWHGKIVETAVDTNTLVRTTVYEDGEVFEDEARVVTPQDSAAAYLRRIAATTNSAPARLAAARQRLLKDKTDKANGVVSNVTVNLTAGR